MDALENILTKGPYRYYKSIHKYCQPLFRTLNFTAFSYALISKDGRNFVLCSNPEHYERYYLDGVFIKDPCCNRAQTHLQNVNVWAAILNRNDPEQLSVYEQQIKDNMYNGICIKVNTDFGYETYDFATNIKDSAILNKWLSHLHLLKTFIAAFKLKYDKIIEKNRDNFIFLPDYIGEDFFSEPNIIVTATEEMTNEAYEAYPVPANYSIEFATKIHSSVTERGKHSLLISGQEIILTQREYDCLACVLAGKTAKETADELLLSYRTVENYLETVKQKTSSRSKLELLSKIGKLKE